MSGTDLLNALDDDLLSLLEAVGHDDVAALLGTGRHAALLDLLGSVDHEHIAAGLIEQDGVAFIFNTVGTATNTAIRRYLNQKKIPHLFLTTGADKWADPQRFPWSIGLLPSCRTEAQIYAKSILRGKPDGKVAVLYQNDPSGKTHMEGIRSVLDQNGVKLVADQGYEPKEVDVSAQVVAMTWLGLAGSKVTP